MNRFDDDQARYATIQRLAAALAMALAPGMVWAQPPEEGDDDQCEGSKEDPDEDCPDVAEEACNGDKADGGCGGDKAEGSCSGDKAEGSCSGEKGEGSCSGIV